MFFMPRYSLELFSFALQDLLQKQNPDVRSREFLGYFSIFWMPEETLNALLTVSIFLELRAARLKQIARSACQGRAARLPILVLFDFLGAAEASVLAYFTAGKSPQTASPTALRSS